MQVLGPKGVHNEDEIASLDEILLATRGTEYNASDKELASFARFQKNLSHNLCFDVLFYIVFEAHVASDFLIAVEDAISGSRKVSRCGDQGFLLFPP